jgi:hypothetical protein
VHENGMVLIRKEKARHDNLVNINLLVIYNQPNDENKANTSDASQSQTSDEQNDNIPSNVLKRKYTKRSVEKRADGGPIMRSRAKFENKTKLKEIEPNFDYNSASVRQAMILIKNLVLIYLIKLFKHRILVKKPEKQIKKRCQLTKNSRKIIQQLDTEQIASLEKSIKTEIQKWKNCFMWGEWLPNSK